MYVNRLALSGGGEAPVGDDSRLGLIRHTRLCFLQVWLVSFETSKLVSRTLMTSSLWLELSLLPRKLSRPDRHNTTTPSCLDIHTNSKLLSSLCQ